ncbi:MAG: M3 family metallopeptidase [Verrucomicrobiota bacterium]
MSSPLLDTSTPRIHWSSIQPEAVEEAITEAITLAEKNLEVLIAIPDEDRTFANTFLGLEKASEELDAGWGRVSHLKDVCSTNALREAYNKVLPEVTAFSASIPLRQDLWKAIKACAAKPGLRDGLNPVEQRFLDETVRDFTQAGADLPEDERHRLEALQQELAAATQKFSENCLDSTNAWDLVIDDESELAGLPASSLEAALAAAREKDLGTESDPRWRITLQAPSYGPVMEYANSDSVRKKVWQGLMGVGRTGDYDNTDLILKILDLRQEKAELLGKEHFADQVTENRMVKKGARALQFVEDFHARVEKQFLGEVEAVREFKGKEAGERELEPWEVGYWSQKLRRAEHDFDPEELRPWFPIDQVLDGMFEITSHLFDIRLTEVPTVFHETPAAPSGGSDPIEVWHTEVKYYDIHDASGVKLGSFYADWHPRESKRAGAWMNYLRTGLPERATADGQREPHVGLMCANLTPSIDGKPALLRLSEVETIFHEFGHLLHHLLGDVEIKSLNGVNVVWDFVELPSQIMENFCWERISLDKFARHHETGEPIPEELFQKMLGARQFQAAMMTMRQLSLGKMDLDLHINRTRDRERNLDELIDSMLKPYKIPTRTPAPSISHMFQHLFGNPTGYAAGYYSYKWAEVLDADAFTRFREAGVLSPEVGREFRDKILSQGNARDAADLFHDFMGREPDIQSLLERSGLHAA